MHYQGSKVPLSERNERFKSAGLPVRRSWGQTRYATMASRRETPEEKKFTFYKMTSGIFASDKKPEVKPVSTDYAFYRPGANVVPEAATPKEKSPEKRSFWGAQGRLDTPSVSNDQHWKMPAVPNGGFKFLRWLTVVTLLLAGGWWAQRKATGALQDAAGLKLEKVIVEGAHYLTQDEILKTVNLTAGTAMFKLSLEDMNQKLSKLSWVDRVFVERRLPSSILISVRERKPVALLDNGILYGVDKDGRILGHSDALVNEDLPLVSGLPFTADAVGTTQEAQSLKPALDFFTFMDKKDPVLAHDVSEVNLSDPESLKVTFINGTQVTFNNTVTEVDLKRMALVLADLNEKGKKAGAMDFRYRDMAFVRTR